MLPRSVSFQGFKTIAWESCEIGECGRRVKYFEPLPALPIKTLERPHELAFGEKLGTLILEAPRSCNTTLIVWTMYVKRKSYFPPRPVAGLPSFAAPNSPLVTSH